MKFSLPLLIILGLFSFTATAHAYSDEQIVNAIRKAEGVWTYGIKTVSCSSESACRKICLNTVRNNRIRYKKYGHEQYPDFISFLQSRYCPTNARTLSKAEKALNGNWLGNVNYFLAKEI